MISVNKVKMNHTLMKSGGE